MLETIMAKEEEHADDMKKILENLGEKLRPEKSSHETKKV
jgi:bacterioferritin (cytochrome b1)